MEPKIRWERAIIIILILIILVCFIVGFSMSKIASYRCSIQCNSTGALTSQTIPNGKWDLHDFCICYYPDRAEAFILGE